MQLNPSIDHVLGQLKDVCLQLTAREYTQELKLLQNNSMGKHIRHILSLYQCLMKGAASGVVDYDNRERRKDVECDPIVAIALIQEILNWEYGVKGNADIKLHADYDPHPESLTQQPSNVSSSFSSCRGCEISTNLKREMLYMIEHAIHHMAILRVAIEVEFPNIKIDDDFGVAYSTLKFRDPPCAP